MKVEKSETFDHHTNLSMNLTELTVEKRVALLQAKITDMKIQIEEKTKKIEDLERCVRS